MKKIMISVADMNLQAELYGSVTAQKIWDALPLEGRANVWGDEIYFSIPVSTELEADARADVDVGTLGYWEPGRAFCIFFGPTPASIDDQPRAASPVNIFGHVVDEVTCLRNIRDGERVSVTQDSDE
ncbi:hypothetical protein CSA56_06115 [candidate division KSB3 bacterium]|uniref:Cyclophilin TM1367-like domain-containing protein n=1 Tax=candidate division KSB3 bacterium TaxID=2044937 RepID=A0A2G6KH36_9BACT|nr:MAG: hypothetical protein CSA56_06115 [candidate division KSB3 bacterium]